MDLRQLIRNKEDAHTPFLMGHGYQKWFDRLSVSDSPLTRMNLAEALGFFHRYMSLLPREMRMNFLKGMDLHERKHRVRTLILPVGTVLSAFRKMNEDPFRLFYTKVGGSIHYLGLNPHQRYFRRFRVISQHCVALESRCAPAIDTWTDQNTHYVAGGGGLQYILPNALMHLELVQLT